jgi:hypothetical protein
MEQTGDGGGGHHGRHHRSGREPVLRGAFDAGGTALELHGEVGEGRLAELGLQPLAQRSRRVQVGAGAHGPAQLLPGAVGVHLVAL